MRTDSGRLRRVKSYRNGADYHSEHYFTPPGAQVLAHTH
jgi:hypothetical protein